MEQDQSKVPGQMSPEDKVGHMENKLSRIESTPILEQDVESPGASNAKHGNREDLR